MAKILIVEDSVTLLEAHKKILERHGHTVITADDGQLGVDMALEHSPDLVLMDIVMPNLNGFQATRKLTKDPQTAHIPVVLVTSKDQQTDILWGKRQGAKGYIVKPVEELELVAQIDELIPAEAS